MSMHWHYIQNGTTLGPIPEEQLRQLISSGALQPSDHVWHDGLAAWTTIQASPELASRGIPPPVRSVPGPPQPGNGQPQTPPRKANKALFWVLGGCGGLLLLVLLGFAVTVFWVRQKVGNLQRNPAVAAAELIVRANPELEVVATDYTKGTITMRDKKTGETLTMDATKVKEGRFAFKDGRGKEFRINALDGGSGTVQVQGPDAQASFGAASKDQTPAWLPTYPGTAVEGVASVTSKSGASGTVVQRTSDSPAQVFEAFEKTLKAAGFTVGTVHTPDGGMVIGDQIPSRRHVVAAIGKNRGQTVVTLTYREGS
ncbi:MAG TPA: DUF4339 domain-containing protein [Geothrix sp.]